MSSKREAPKSFVDDLCCSETGEIVLHKLLASHADIPDLAQQLCQSPDILSCLVKELEGIQSAITPPANPPGLSLSQAQKVCQILDLMKRVVAHPEAQITVLQKGLLVSLIPILKSVDKSPPSRELRQKSIGLVQDLVLTQRPNILRYLIEINIFDSLFSLMQTARETCRTASTLVLQRLLREDDGLKYICDFSVRLVDAVTSLDMVVLKLSDTSSPPRASLENMLRCYCLLASDPRGRKCVREHLPVQLVNDTIRSHLASGSLGERYYSELIDQLKTPQA